MNGARVLVAGIGNVFFGDDGFGVEVARRLGARPQPEGVQVADFGIRGLDLAYALLDGYDAAILVDAVPRGGPPGTLYVLEPEAAAGPVRLADTHGLEPATILGMLRTIGDDLPVLRIVGCEPAAGADDAEMTVGLSPAVAAVVDEAVALVEAVVLDLRHEAGRRA